MRPAPRSRRFNLLDALVLIAVGAVSVRGYQGVMVVYGATGVTSPAVVIESVRRLGVLGIPLHVLYWFEVAAPTLLASAFGLFALRWAPPRPRRGRLARQPGAVAVMASAAGAAAVLGAWFLVGQPLVSAGKFTATPLSPIYPLILRVMLVAMVAAGASVTAGWATLASRGPFWKEADWVEWCGRALGTTLVLATPFYLWAALIIF